MGSLLVAVILINSLAIFTILLNPPFLEFIEFNQTLALAGLEVVIVAIVGYFSLILSHKIAGPAYALVRDLKRVADGDLTVRTRLRKGDFHMEIADAFNLTTETLYTRIKKIKASLTSLQQQADIDASTRQVLNEVLSEMAHFKLEAVVMAGMEKPRTNK
jgi:methyl-accepting chemotaxis protein